MLKTCLSEPRCHTCHSQLAVRLMGCDEIFSWVSFHRGISMPFPWWSKTCFFLLQNEVLLAEDNLHHLFPMTVFRYSGEEECGKISDLLTPHLKNHCLNIVIFAQNNKYWVLLSLYFWFLSLGDMANLNFPVFFVSMSVGYFLFKKCWMVLLLHNS